MLSALEVQQKAIEDQQAATMASLDEQFRYMNLPAEQQEAYIQQYQQAFKQQQELSEQQKKLVEKGAWSRRLRNVRLLLILSHIEATNILRQNVLYLMIVNMPSEEDMANAREQTASSNESQPDPNLSLSMVEV